MSSKRLISVDRQYYRKYGSPKFAGDFHGEWSFFDPEEAYFDYLDGIFSHSRLGIIEAEEGLRRLDKRLLPYADFEDGYAFGINSKDRNIVDIPVKVIYSKVLSVSEKLAIIWRLVLESRTDTKMDYKSLSKISGISERTFRKAKKQYPGLFRKNQTLI